MAIETAWKNELRPGSFKGVPFVTRKATYSFKTSLQKTGGGHGYSAKTIKVYKKTIDIEAIIIGDDYFLGRDALLKVLLDGKAGTLVHPYFGNVEVVCDSFSEEQSTEKGGSSFFKISFEPHTPLKLNEWKRATKIKEVHFEPPRIKREKGLYDDLKKLISSVTGFSDMITNQIAATVDQIKKASSLTEDVALMVLKIRGDLKKCINMPLKLLDMEKEVFKLMDKAFSKYDLFSEYKRRNKTLKDVMFYIPIPAAAMSQRKRERLEKEKRATELLMAINTNKMAEALEDMITEDETKKDTVLNCIKDLESEINLLLNSIEDAVSLKEELIILKNKFQESNSYKNSKIIPGDSSKNIVTLLFKHNIPLSDINLIMDNNKIDNPFEIKEDLIC